MNNDKVTMSKFDFWNLRVAHEEAAIKSGDVRQMALCAQVRMNHVATGVTNSDRSGQLAYEDHTQHMYVAGNLIQAARDREGEIYDQQRQQRRKKHKAKAGKND